ncbi:MAG: hypothetical protein ABR936_05150 [Bacteroidota bacterium]
MIPGIAAVSHNWRLARHRFVVDVLSIDESAPDRIRSSTIVNEYSHPDKSGRIGKILST